MNYSKNLRKAAMAKRVLTILCVALLLGLVIGGVSGYALKGHITAKDKKKRSNWNKYTVRYKNPCIWGV